MNARLPPPVQISPALYRIAISRLGGGSAEAKSSEGAWLATLAKNVGDAALAQWLVAPPAEDARLHALARELGLKHAEILAVALACAVESDPMMGRVLAWLQAPVGLGRPTLGLLQSIADQMGIGDALPSVLDGHARACGLLQLEAESKPLPEQTFLVAVPTVLALLGQGGTWPGVRLLERPTEEFPPSLQEAVKLQARALRADWDMRRGAGSLAIRSGHPREARAAAAHVAHELGMLAAVFEQEPPRGLGPWLWLRRAVPVLCTEPGPGETRRLPELPGYRGPLLIASGLDGSFEREGEPVGSWRIPLPLPGERVALWQTHLDKKTAELIGRQHRHSPAHIEYLARAAHHEARLMGDKAIAHKHVRQAARNGAAGELGTLAQLLPENVPDDALVTPPDLRMQLLALRQRCERREGLADHLGPSARTRYRPGVRALLVGPSGTGKTLAVGWIATSLGLPLYRVDLSSVVSKYIGETEKNLAQLFARAETAEVILLFDEADAMFGKRTEQKDSNDRFANQQTNYLLQRIESFDGIAILTSNSRSRFDSAFTRRLDAIIDFPAPGPDERRALWLAHLGAQHALEIAQINRIAANCDLAGGHIRNATLAAASLTAPVDGGPVLDYGVLRQAIESEYRKLGRQVPAGL
jgi:hypothetical protein